VDGIASAMAKHKTCGSLRGHKGPRARQSMVRACVIRSNLQRLGEQAL